MLKTNNQNHASADVSSWYTTRRLFGADIPTTILTKEAWPNRSNGPPHPARCVCHSCHQSGVSKSGATEMIPVLASNGIRKKNGVGRVCALNFLVTASADRGGLRHKVLFGSVDKQAPPYTAMNYKTPADYIARPRHIKPGNLTPTSSDRSAIGLTIVCNDQRTDRTAFVSRIRKTTNGLNPTQRTA